jgi:hypothetical protein
MTTESAGGGAAEVDWVLVPDVDELAGAVNESEDLLLALCGGEEDSTET